jgi:hypothetical protein
MKTLLACLLATSVAFAEEHQHPATAATTPQFDQLKTLVGNWDGTMVDAGKTMPTHTSFKMVSGNSVLMNTLAEGTPHEMVTMFHLDQKDLMATHYCAGQNQPRFKATAGAVGKAITFTFTDGTNLENGHMQKVVFTFVDGDHHTEDWTYHEKSGKDSTSHFDFKRKK